MGHFPRQPQGGGPPRSARATARRAGIRIRRSPQGCVGFAGHSTAAAGQQVVANPEPCSAVETLRRNVQVPRPSRRCRWVVRGGPWDLCGTDTTHTYLNPARQSHPLGGPHHDDHTTDHSTVPFPPRPPPCSPWSCASQRTYSASSRAILRTSHEPIERGRHLPIAARHVDWRPRVEWGI